MASADLHEHVIFRRLGFVEVENWKAYGLSNLDAFQSRPSKLLWVVSFLRLVLIPRNTASHDDITEKDNKTDGTTRFQQKHIRMCVLMNLALATSRCNCFSEHTYYLIHRSRRRAALAACQRCRVVSAAVVVGVKKRYDPWNCQS